MKRKLWLLLLCLSAAFLLCVSVSAVDVNNETALRDAIVAGNDVKLQSDISLNAPLTVEKSLTLDLDGKALTLTASEGSVIQVSSGAHLIVRDSSPASGHYDNNRHGGQIRGGKGTKITDKYNWVEAPSGGGICVMEGSTLTMTGGAVYTCSAERGGGIFVASGSKVILNYEGGLRPDGDWGAIDSCTATYGGGVYVDLGGKLEIENDNILYCEAVQGGGVYVAPAGVAELKNSSMIKNCKAEGSGDVYGGGVYVVSRGNPAAYGEGDGEKIEYGFRMSENSVIQSCSASSTGSNAYGGGVYVGWKDDDGVFVMDDSSRIENCKVSAPYWAYGGGVCVENIYNDSYFKMNGGSIAECEAVSTSNYTDHARGGGVSVKDGVFEMNGGTIEYSCKGIENGNDIAGGVYIWEGTMHANGGSVECTVMNHNEITCTNANGSAEFKAAVKNAEMHAVIRGGTFRGDVDNRRGYIEGGEFYGIVDNGGDGTGATGGGSIYGGTFHSFVRGSYYISGGTFDLQPQYSHIVTFDSQGGTEVPLQYRLNAAATEPKPAPENGDQQFLGWYTDIDCTQPYEFDNTKREERIVRDTTLYALWSGGRRTVSFESNGGSEVEQQTRVIPGRQAAEPPDPTKQNATFLGWFTESGKHWNFAHDPVNENITLYAKWSDGKLPDPPEPKRFTVTFNANGGDGVMEPLTVTEGSSCRLPACTFTAPEGKEFDTWEIDGAKYGESALYPVTANTEVKVLWKDAGDTPDQPDVPGQAYSITIFPSDGGTVTAAPASAAASTEILLTVTPDSGYHFQRWNVFPENLTISKALGNAYSFKMPASNVVLQAIFEADDTPNPPQPTEFTVTFDANGGSGSMEPGTVEEGTSYLLPECAFTAPEGKEFDAWEIDGARYLVGDPYLINANITATALWKDIDNNPGQLYSITILPSEGGTVTASHTSAEADTQIRLTVTPDSGYLLEQCKAIEPRDLIVGPIDTNVYMFYMPESNVVLQPVFVKYQTTEFTVTFDANGGMPEVSSMETVNGRLPSLPGAIHSGRYRFAGWYTAKLGGERVTTQTVFSEDTTVYAHWVRTGGSGGSGGSTKKDPEKKDTAAERKFVDVPKGGYFEDAVDWAVENGITTGTDASHFSPDDVCTRAQAVTFLWRAAGCPQPKNRTMPFTDVPKSSYFYDAVLWAVEAGITKGTSDTKFSPDDLCTRAQIAVFLWRSEGSPLAEGPNPFADVAANAYYADAVLWAVAEDITMGTSRTTFSPDDTCTRAQIVTFLWRCKK